MKYLKKFYQLITEKKDRFPNIKKMEIEGFSVMLGRDAKSNDHLTFNVAFDDDIWMHIKDVPGSHVVIKVKDNLPTENVLKQAAQFAKKYSKGDKIDNLPVIYCKRKFVKKEKGMNDGQVKVDSKNAYEINV
jgi:predicted ribosome quality control (RQC) complex YloA/Tae2 family protein